ncbi:MAG: ergothioneine biosynthesis protein EgtB [Bacteroidales bacterium]|nr:ergothioneine biosynthesis protein EgtB [Bacteroidales bacterium]
MERQDSLLVKYSQVRARSIELCAPLQVEDYVVQPTEDVSPPKWHLGHTTWFFESLILKPNIKKYQYYNEKYNYIFNSYYESLGERIMRVNRGNLSRPTVNEVLHYREVIDENVEIFLSNTVSDEILDLIETGLNHEQQHQELLITDIKYILGHNPLFPSYKLEYDKSLDRLAKIVEPHYLKVPAKNYQVGYNGDDFHFDNEESEHQVYLSEFRFSDMLVTNKEYVEFIADKAYKRFELWLSDGWDWVQKNNIKSPLYWHLIDKSFYEYTLTNGLQKINPDAPVTHISFYEADAFARWKKQRLLTEFEWEVAVKKYIMELDYNLSNFQDNNLFHPLARKESSYQLIGDVWEWTNSAYLPYPGYNQPQGALGEYNAKFMMNQMVLRGGSCATPIDHFRASYRNFFQPEKRWQFTGIRLAYDESN